jgi:hypothetical protein
MSEMQSGRKLFSVALALCGFLLAGTQTNAQEVHLNIPVPGGMPGRPIMTGITGGTNSVTMTWDGPSGYYQLYQKLGLGGQPWQAVGGPNFGLQATVPASGNNAFFRVSGPSAQYAGAISCSECHESTYNLVATTPHGQAFEALKQVHQQTNPNCLVCHTVGFGLPTGFVNASATPELAGVQCENCHGPGAKHAANEMDLTVRPRVDIAGQVCGGCHNVAEHPTFDQWKSSGHFAVVEDMNPPERINSCGRCHSGTARLALVNGQDPAVAAHNDANVGITCVVCHDPHQNHATYNVLTGQTTVSQLRYPVASTNYFSLSTTAPFQNPSSISVCAQCHNDRGAAWTTTSRPPHYSPQYNILLGSVGLRSGGFTNINGVPVEIVLNGAYATNAQPHPHGLWIKNQCVGCHMQVDAVPNATLPPVAGHSFAVATYNVCLPCHPADPEGFAGFMQDFVIKPRIQQLVADLNHWATTKAPEVLRTNYGALAWEYTSPGGLSSGTNGPTTAQQSLIPDNIKWARFNLYVVQNDGSFGIHNPDYSKTLLDTALAWVQQ